MLILLKKYDLLFVFKMSQNITSFVHTRWQKSLESIKYLKNKIFEKKMFYTKVVKFQKTQSNGDTYLIWSVSMEELLKSIF